MPERVRHGWVRSVSCVVGALVSASAGAGESGTVTIHGEVEGSVEVPVVARIEANLPPGAYLLRPKGAGPAQPAQIYEDEGRSYLALILKPGDSADSRAYSLTPDPTPDPDEAVSLRPRGDDVEIETDDQLITRYIAHDGPKPYLYPLIAPTGEELTRNYPMKPDVPGETTDHPHHRSFWFTFGDVNGIDFWTELERTGSIRESDRKTRVSGPVVGVLRTADDWIGPDGAKVCSDERELRVYHTRTARLLDFQVTLKATAGPVTFGDTKEGMFGVRVASTMDVDRQTGGRIVNSEGQTDDDAWGQPAHWVDYSGPVGDRTVGISILEGPQSFRSPTTWHARTYGLFAANPFGWNDFGLGKSGRFVLPAGESITFRYRIILHSGAADSLDLPAAYRAYAHPPSVEVRAD